jgi:hypothetical protein
LKGDFSAREVRREQMKKLLISAIALIAAISQAANQIERS